MSTPITPAAQSPADLRLLLASCDRSVLVASANSDDGASFTYALEAAPPTPSGKGLEPVTVRVPTTPAAGLAVEREARLLVEMRRRRLGIIEATIPRHVGVRSFDGRRAMLSTTLPGESMAVGYHRWLHTARPQAVSHDYRLAAAWLGQLQDASSGPLTATPWVHDVTVRLCDRWQDHPLLPAASVPLARAQGRLDSRLLPTVVVHGDFRFGNILLDADRVSGVVNWTDGEIAGSPLRDLARFAVGYTSLLDHSTRPGAHVVGHPGLRRVGPVPGLTYAVLARSWYARIVRSFLAVGLMRVGVPPAYSYDVVVAGIGELAATAGDERSAEDYLTVLAALPA